MLPEAFFILILELYYARIYDWLNILWCGTVQG